MKIEKFLARHYELWPTLGWRTLEGQRRRFETIRKLLSPLIPPLHRTRYCEIGCGLGDLIPWLPNKAFYSGYDQNWEYIQFCRKRYSDPAHQFTLFTIDPESLDLASEISGRHELPDFIVMSGLFSGWKKEQIYPFLETLVGCSVGGIVFNLLMETEQRILEGDTCFDREEIRDLITDISYEREVTDHWDELLKDVTVLLKE